MKKNLNSTLSKTNNTNALEKKNKRTKSEKFSVKALLSLLEKRKETLSLAESCTGGLIASKIVGEPGASKVFLGGIVSYSNEAKEKILGVSRKTLENAGAVSEETVLEMSRAARQKFNADWAISVSGVAGPGGGTPEKPVGLVWFSISGKSFSKAFFKKFSGSRNKIRKESVSYVLNELFLCIKEEECSK